MDAKQPIREVLEFLRKTNGDEALVGRIFRSIDQRRLITGKDRWTYIQSRGLKYTANEAIRDKQIINLDQLVRFVRGLRLTPNELLEFQTAQEPWTNCVADDRVVVVHGGKLTRLPHGPADMRYPVVGVRDALALGMLHRILREAIDAPFVLEQQLVLPELPGCDARERLDQLCSEGNVGVVIALGSELVNPIVAPMAERMLAGLADVPAKFRWAFPLIPPSLLSDPAACDPGKEGIAYRYRRDFLPRVGDTAILESARSSTRRRPLFSDCGLLMIDATQRPTLVLCAGHGGCGTVAATLGLERGTYIEKALRNTSSDDSSGRVGVGRLFEPVILRRGKPTEEAVDDLEFNHTYDRGWFFYEDSEAEGFPTGR